MDTKALKKQMGAAIAMVLVAAIALGSATFAWFVTNNKVDATTSTISAQSNAAYMVIANGDNEATSSDVSSVATEEPTAKLFPATFGEEEGSTNGKFMTGYGSTLTNGSLSSTLKLVKDTGKPLDAVEAQYAQLQKFSISSKGQNLNNLKVEKVEGATGDHATTKPASDLQKALRVLVTNEDFSTWVTYGLNEKGDAYEVKTKASSAADPNFGTVTANQNVNVRVFLFYEGSDTNITTKNLQDGILGEVNNVTVYFTADMDNK